jgi:excisionase family DNA binding protein
LIRSDHHHDHVASSDLIMFSARPTIDPVSEKLFTIQDAAAALGCSKLTVRRWEKSGRIPPARRVSGQRRYSQADLDRLVRLATGRLPEEHGAEQSTEWGQPEDEQEPGSWRHLEGVIDGSRWESHTQRDDHGQPVQTARPRQPPRNPFGLDEDGDDEKIALEYTGDQWEAHPSEARLPVCRKCGERVTRVNGSGGRLVWTDGVHTSEAPEWIPDPSARASRGVATFPLSTEPPARRQRGLTQSDIVVAIRAAKPHPKPSVSFLDPAPHSARPS